MSKTRASASSRVPNTGKEMKVSRCLETVMKHKARVFDVLSNQTIINYAVFHFCPSPKKHAYMHDELLLCSWRPTMSEDGALSVRFREPRKGKITEVSSVLGPSTSATEVKISEEKDLSCLTSSDAQDVVSAGPLNSCSFANCSVKIKVQYLQ